VLEKVFSQKVASPEWQQKIRQIVPSYGTKLNGDPQRVYHELAYTSEHLQLTPPPQIGTPAPAPAPAETGTVKPVPDMAP
jgi:malate dehydrogenase (quinone)